MGRNESREARNERQRRHRQRLQDAGLTPVTVTVPAERAQEIKAIAARMTAGNKVTIQMTTHHWLLNLPEVGSPGYDLTQRIADAEAGIEQAQRALEAARTHLVALETEAEAFATRHWTPEEVMQAKRRCQDEREGQRRDHGHGL